MDVVDRFGVRHNDLLVDTTAVLEWCIHHQRFDALSFKDHIKLKLANYHMNIWRRQGVRAEIHHLQRAKELFQEYISRHGSMFPKISDSIEYFKCLLFLGDFEEASHIITGIISSSESDNNHAMYCFFGGVAFKANKDYEKANSLFFDAIQSGPPQLFNKIEMMTIVSRILEEMNANGEDENEDAYKMVSSQCKLLIITIVKLISTSLGTCSYGNGEHDR